MEQPLVNSNSNATSVSAREAAAAAAKYNLRTKSIQNRIEVERRKNAPRHPKPKQRPAPLSKYRRRTANFRERCRMQEMNDAFKRLQSVVPGDEQSREAAAVVAKQSLGTSAAAAAAASKATKIHTLKLAVNYISALTAMLNGQSQEQTLVPAKTQISTYSIGSTNNTSSSNHHNHCNQSSVSSQTMFMMGPKNKACQTMFGGSGGGGGGGSCVAASQTEQPRQPNQHSHLQHRPSDLNPVSNLSHCQQRPPLPHSYSTTSPSSYSYSSAQHIGHCVPGQNSSANKQVPLSIDSSTNQLCEISPPPFYGYSNQPRMSHESAVHPTTAVMPAFSTSADNHNNSNHLSSIFLPSGHSHLQSVTMPEQLGNSVSVASPFDSLMMEDSAHHPQHHQQHYSLVSPNQALLDDFSAIIDDLQQQAEEEEEEDSTFALVDGLID